MKIETIKTTIKWTKGDKPKYYDKYLVYGKEIVRNKEVKRMCIMYYELNTGYKQAREEWKDERGYIVRDFVIEYYAPAILCTPIEHVCESSRLPSLVRCCKECREVIR